MDNTADNIADEPVEQPVAEHVGAGEIGAGEIDVDEAAYLQKFTDLDTQADHIGDLIESIKKQPNDQERLYVALEIIKQLQKKSCMQDDLLVEMNNYFGARA